MGTGRGDVETTVLPAVEETMDAMREAQRVHYRLPGS
jgi:hypothetical protein